MSWKVVTKLKHNKTLLWEFADKGFYRLNWSHKKKCCTVGKTSDALLYKTRVVIPETKEVLKTWALMSGTNMWQRGERYLMPWSLGKLIFKNRKDAVKACKEINASGDETAIYKAYTDIWDKTNIRYKEFSILKPKTTETKVEKKIDDSDGFPF